MKPRTIERYSKSTIIFHWTHASAFVILVLTGGFLFLPGVGITSASFAIGILHRVAAVVFTGMSLGYAICRPRKVGDFIRETFSWGKDDLTWLMAAPGYYFGSRSHRMPPQGHVNTGQKLWQLVIIETGTVLLATGTVLWFFRSAIGIAVYQWILLAHGIAFVAILTMFLIHVYMGVFHPRSTESLSAMLDGKISPSYAKSHYRKWYDRMIGTPQD